MSLDNSFRAYGRFLVTWNTLQPVLDVAIVREAGLDPSRGAILVAALNPKSRLTVLRGLLVNAGGEKADIVPLLAEIAQATKKQPILQGAPLPGGVNSLVFSRIDPQGRLAPGSTEYSAEEINQLADELAEHIETISTALAVSQADVQALHAAGEETAARRRKDTEAEE